MQPQQQSSSSSSSLDEIIRNTKGSTGLFFSNYDYLPPRVARWMAAHPQLDSTQQNAGAATPEDVEKEAQEFEEFVEMLKQSGHPSTIPQTHLPNFQQAGYYDTTANQANKNSFSFSNTQSPRMMNEPDQVSDLSDQQFMEQINLFQQYKAFAKESQEQEENEKRTSELLTLKENLNFVIETYSKCYSECMHDGVTFDGEKLKLSHSLDVSKHLNKWFGNKEKMLSERQVSCLESCAAREFDLKDQMKDKFLDRFLNTDWSYAQLAAQMYSAVHAAQSSSSSSVLGINSSANNRFSSFGGLSASTGSQVPEPQSSTSTTANMFGGLPGGSNTSNTNSNSN